MNNPIIKGSAGNLNLFASLTVAKIKLIPQNDKTTVNKTSNIKSGFLLWFLINFKTKKKNATKTKEEMKKFINLFSFIINGGRIFRFTLP